jgi:peptide/nickel transport system substrate-binding protein
MKMSKKYFIIMMLCLFFGTCLVISTADIVSGAEKGRSQPQTQEAKSAKTPQYGGTLRVVSVSEGRDIGYPPKLNVSDGYRVAGAAIETLFRMDRTANLVPWLATSRKEDSKAKTIILTLRQGVKFHDGTNFNAEAVKWNLDEGVRNKVAGTEKISSVDIINDNTVRINLTEWDNGVSNNLAQNLGMIISPTTYKTKGEDWAATHPIGTGPFQFVSWEKDQKVTFKKFPGYWQKGKPYLDGIEFNVVVDSMTREFTLRNREADLMMGVVSPKIVVGLQKDGFAVTSINPGSGSTCLVPSSADPRSPWADVRVRRAVVHAIDRAAIVKNVYENVYVVANQWVPAGHWGWNPSVVGYGYNQAKARKLLTEAGYPNGFKTKLTYRSTAEYDQTFIAVQGFLKEVGIDMMLEPVATTAVLHRLQYDGVKWDGLLVSGANSNPDAASYLALRYSGGGKNFNMMVVPDDYVKAVKSSITATDFKAKQKMVHTAMKLMIDKYALVIPLFSITDTTVCVPAVHTHGMTTTQSNLWTPENVWMEKR